MNDSRPAKPKLRWYQFSLRSLLILTTIFAVWLGLRVDRARKQQRAVEALRQIGGEVLYVNHFQHNGNSARFDKGEPLAPEWLNNFLGIDFFGSVRTVYLYDKTTDEHLSHLESLPDVETLVLCHT